MNGARDERGFALLAVLWTLIGVATLALTVQLAARASVGAARNRADAARAAWLAEGCAERGRAAIAAALRASRDDASAWDRVPGALSRSPLAEGCDVAARAAGAALDINHADAETLRRLMLHLGARPAEADSLADALLDWRDADGEPRPYGAEAPQYAGRRPPRNGPLAHPDELLRVRGFGRFAGLDTLLGTEPGRIPLGHAPSAVIASLPGFTPEALARIRDARGRGEAAGDLTAIAAVLSASAREEMRAHLTELNAMTSPQPEAWILTARARKGAPALTAVVELRLVRAGERAAVVRRRTWVE